MNAEGTRTVVNELVRKELVYANDEYEKLFNSAHEGYAILKEEIEEAEVELSRLKLYLDSLWYTVRDNTASQEDKELYLHKHAVNLAEEAVQIAAMAQKFALSKGTWSGKE